MTSFEEFDKQFDTPENDSLYKDALAYCQEIQKALDLVKQLTESEFADDEMQARLASAYAESVVHQSLYGGLKYKLNISVPEGIKAEISKNWEVIDPEPRQFVATEVRYIGKEQVDFLDVPSGNWLIVYGHQMEITPLLPDPSN